MGQAFLLPLSIASIVIAGIVILVLLLGNDGARRSKALASRVRTYSGNNENEVSEKEAGNFLQRLHETGQRRTANVIEKRGWTAKLAQGMSAAGLALRPEEFALICVGAAGVGAGGMFMLAGASVPAGILGGCVGFIIPVMVLRLKASRRQKRFVADLPDMLTALASALSSGSSLPQAVEGIALEADGPLADELNRAIMEMRLGTSIPDALDGAAKRMKCDDLEMVVMAIRLQSSHGGNLAELLTTVSFTLRERVQMKRHVAALSAEGRMSLMVLMALPVCMLGFMAVIRPEYFDFFVGTTNGLIMISTFGIMMLLGFLWARSIVKVEV